jgi:hypothetical protein
MPFRFERTTYLYDAPGGLHQGGHAHKGLGQFIFAISGSFDVALDDGSQRQKLTLMGATCNETKTELDDVFSNILIDQILCIAGTQI